MAEEGWDFVEGLKRTKTARVCMTCQHFTYLTDEDCRTLLSCGLQKRLVPHGEHPVSYTHLTLPTILLV